MFRVRRCPLNWSREHVIPKWAQRRFALYDKHLTLINGTRIPYRHLTIPCCERCNTGFLSNIESALLRTLEPSDSKDTGERLALARWLCKILIGILVKETTLSLDQRDPSKGKILPDDFLSEFAQAQLIMQSARKPTTFVSLHGKYPFTLYRYRIERDDNLGDFDLSTNLVGQSIAVRIGTIGAIFVNDGGLQYKVGDKGPRGLDGRKLHPIQFSEVAAWAHYKATLRDATHSYTTIETPEQLVINQMSVRPFTNTFVSQNQIQMFRPWEDIECANFIERYTRDNRGPVYDPVTGLFTTTLRNKRGGLPSSKTLFRNCQNP